MTKKISPLGLFAGELKPFIPTKDNTGPATLQVEGEKPKPVYGITPNDRVLVGALLWLRNHYDVGRPELKESVLAHIDSVLRDADAQGADHRAFREAYLVGSKEKRSKG